MSSETSFQNPQTREKFALILISILFLLSIEGAFFQWLPAFMIWIRRGIICFFLVAPSISSSRATKVREFMIPVFSSALLFIRFPSLYITSEMSFPISNFNAAVIDVAINILAISLTIPWCWLIYQLSTLKVMKYMILGISIVLYPLTLIGLFTKYSELLYASFWVILFSLQIISFLLVSPLYSSKRINRGKFLIVFAHLFLGGSILMSILFPSKIVISLAYIAVDIFLYISWFIIFANSELLIMSPHLTITVGRKYNQIKMDEERSGEQCIVFYNINEYFKNIPDDILTKIDDNELTNLWINIQK